MREAARAAVRAVALAAVLALPAAAGQTGGEAGGQTGGEAGGQAADDAAGGLRIVALGDSLVHGYGLPPEDGFVPELDRWLDAHGAAHAEVINAGVSGDTTAGGLARLDWSLSEGADALIVVLGGNDLLRAIPPETTRENLDALIGEARDRGLPVLIGGMEAPLNYGEDWKAAFDAIYPELAAKHDALLYESFLAGVAEDRSLWQPDGLHPNAEGVDAIVEGIGPKVLDLIARAETEG